MKPISVFCFNKNGGIREQSFAFCISFIAHITLQNISIWGKDEAS